MDQDADNDLPRGTRKKIYRKRSSKYLKMLPDQPKSGVSDLPGVLHYPLTMARGWKRFKKSRGRWPHED